jgi:hypothetical protein
MELLDASAHAPLGCRFIREPLISTGQQAALHPQLASDPSDSQSSSRHSEEKCCHKYMNSTMELNQEKARLLTECYKNKLFCGTLEIHNIIINLKKHDAWKSSC